MAGALPPTYVLGFHDEQLVRRMEYRKLGQTGLRVSKLALGGAALSTLFDKDFDVEEGIRTVQQAIKSGVNYIDTAPFYGQGKSEELLGRALKDVPREAYYIATKVARYELDLRYMFDYSPQKTRESVERSLKLLGLEHIDVLQVHDVDVPNSLDTVLYETIPALEEFVKAKKARFIGITGYDVEVLKECAERARGRVHIVLSYGRYTLLDNTLLRHMNAFRELNVGVVCASAQALGLLTNTGPQPWHPGSEELLGVGRRAAEICVQRGVELGKLAAYYSMQLNGAATFLMGMPTRRQLQINLDAALYGLTGAEQEVLQYLRENVFKKTYSWGATITTLKTFKPKPVK
ncbi:L-galactose dehydrogenase [Scaptodrosophila lebanonensis]|uniref:L-galactose dehydrogenase n=1 Tax=Drosophila lebanonensis TaxID=7225 RepID=A0A6J2TGE2_DROLE|nr:L-galactose dehydrogenase [Scaptodrosophila lebanonensis]